MSRTRNMTLGALATAAAGAAILPALATGHTVAVTCESNRIVAQGSLFPASPPVVSAMLTIDGITRPPVAIVPGIPGPNPRYVFDEPVYGSHVVQAVLENGGLWQSPATPVTCGPPPTPETPTGGGGGTTPQAPPDCADNLARFPGAGANHRDAWGCPASNMRTKPPRKVRRGVVAPPCRVYLARPANGVGEGITPRLGRTVRVLRSNVDGRWYGFRDRFVVTRYPDGDLTVRVRLGAYCGPRAIAGNG